ncbi:MAG: MCE family protein [Proteobacteria bacterium]|nr:MCE family protein [Pseudomonadota bacterium]
MRSSKINYLIVGLFVLAMIGALVTTVAMLTGRTGAVDNYYTYYANVTGIKFGTQVVYEGYPIGQVEQVTPEEKDGRMRFRIDFSVIEGWRIPKDSVGEIAAPGLLAAVTISIQAGSDKVSLKPGEMIISKERSDVFAVVSGVAGQLGDLMDSNIKPLLSNVDKAVQTINRIIEKEGEGLFEDARKVTKDLSELVAFMAGRVPKIADNVEEFSARMNEISNELGNLITPANREKIEQVIASMDETSKKIDTVLESLNGLLGDVGDLLGDVGELVLKEDGDVRQTLADTRYIVQTVSRHIDSINQNMEAAARNMYEFTRQIRQNPGLLLGGEAPKDQSLDQ